MADSLIIANEELAIALDEKLESLPFGNLDKFIELYNFGYIQRNNKDISEIVDELIAAYKGIEKNANGITFLDRGEISADELVAKAEAYTLLLRLQRIAKQAGIERKLNDESLVYIGKGGVLYRLGEQQEDGSRSEDVALSAEKLPRISSEGLRVVGTVVEVDNYSAETPFRAQSLLRVQSQPVIDALEIFG